MQRREEIEGAGGWAGIARARGLCDRVREGVQRHDYARHDDALRYGAVAVLARGVENEASAPTPDDLDVGKAGGEDVRNRGDFHEHVLHCVQHDEKPSLCRNGGRDVHTTASQCHHGVKIAITELTRISGSTFENVKKLIEPVNILAGEGVAQ